MYDPHFRELIIPSLADFLDEDRDEIRLCSITVIKKSLNRMKQFRPKCSDFFVLTTKRKILVFETPFCFGLDW